MLTYLNLDTSHGKRFAYFRRPGEKSIRLPDDLDSPEFLAAYQAALAVTAPKLGIPSKAPAGSLQALWDAYERSPEFRQTSLEHQKNIRRLLRASLKKYGDRMVSGMNQAWVYSIRDAMGKTQPSKAHHFVGAIRLLINWGIPRGYKPRDGNPALGIKPLRTGAGHRRWTDAEFAAMTGPGAEEIAVGVYLGFYSAQRLSDVLAIPWSAYDGATITLRQRKTRHAASSQVMTIQVHPELKRVLDARQRALRTAGRIETMLCTRPDGTKWTRFAFGDRFAEIRAELGLPDDLHFHGLRHSILSALAEQGASAPELQGLSGHASLASLQRYITQAGQKPLAAAALARLPVPARPKTRATRRHPKKEPK